MSGIQLPKAWKHVHNARTLRQDVARLNIVKKCCAHSAQGEDFVQDSAEIVSAGIPKGFHGTLSVRWEISVILACIVFLNWALFQTVCVCVCVWVLIF